MEKPHDVPSSAVVAETSAEAVAKTGTESAHHELSSHKKEEAAEDVETGDAQDLDTRGGYLRGAKVPMGKKQFWIVLLGYVCASMLLHCRNKSKLALLLQFI